MSRSAALPVIGVIGLGDQGLPMATAIARGGNPSPDVDQVLGEPQPVAMLRNALRVVPTPRVPWRHVVRKCVETDEYIRVTVTEESTIRIGILGTGRVAQMLCALRCQGGDFYPNFYRT